MSVSGGKSSDFGQKSAKRKIHLLQLLVRHYAAQQGQLSLSGNPIEDYAENALREHICFLNQRIHVFSDSLRNNLQIAARQPISDENT